MIHLSAAKVTAKRQNLRPELARTLLGQANLEVARGCQERITYATSLLKEALVIFEELNMADAAGRVRHQLDSNPSHLDNSTPQSFPADLTKSEVKVLQLVVQGKRNRQIAQKLEISEKTVANHLSHIFSKTASENRAAATAFAIRHDLA